MLRDTTTKRLSFNDHMDRWYAAHPEIIRVDWPDGVEQQKAPEIVVSPFKVRVVETGKHK